MSGKEVFPRERMGTASGDANQGWLEVKRAVTMLFGRPLDLDSLRGSSVKIGTIQRRLAWPLRKDDTHKSRSVPICCVTHRVSAGRVQGGAAG